MNPMPALLLADGDHHSLSAVETFLHSLREVASTSVSSGQDALDELRTHQYDLIITGSQLTDMNAIRFLGQIRDHGIETPALLLDDRKDPALPGKALASGAQSVVTVHRDGKHLNQDFFSGCLALIERHRTLERLRIDNRIMQAVIASSPIPTCVVRNRRIVWINEIMAKTLGYDEHELINADPLMLLPESGENPRIDELIAGVSDETGWNTAATAIKKKDGSVFDALLRSRSIDPEHPSLGTIVTGQDISEYSRMKDLLRKSELRCYDLVNNAKSIVLRIDPHGKLRFINRFGETFFGYAPDELTGKAVVGSILPKKSRSGRDLDSMLLQVMENPEQYEFNVNENMKKSGERVWIAWSNHAIRDEHGDLVEMLSIGNDITDRESDPDDPLSTVAWMSTIIEDTDISYDIFEAVYSIAAEISRDGREGRVIGTAFLIGDADQVLAHSVQLILNPFEGHDPATRAVSRSDIRETIKELAQLDGAFVIRGNGLVEAAARYISVDAHDIAIPKGFGTRHASIAAITEITRAVGIVVSQSGGRISIFRHGRIVRIIPIEK
ncbi:MAG: PAS domain S-box protein [Methanomicrobiaceae archaeon]|nr:PAS domain S-box protein [Methanomicrobiaceae archaeon]